MQGKKYSLLLILSICSFSANSQIFEESPISEVFPDVFKGSINWVDYNSDGYLDIFITGVASSSAPSSGHPISKLFKNINGKFQEVDTSIEDSSNGDSDWVDYDNDGDLDLLITGLDFNAKKFTKLYANNVVSFTEVIGQPFAQVGFWGGSTWADYDLDGDLDVFIVGNISPGGTISELYRNDAGAFTKVDISVFGVNKVGGTRAIEWLDFDNDNDPDLMLVSQSEAILYQNNNGDFQIVSDTPFHPKIEPTLNVIDYDSDNDLDIMIAGQFSTQLYTNENGTYVLNTSLSDVFVQLNVPAIAWADYDNDSDLDVFVTGYSNVEQKYVSRLYENKNGTFEPLEFDFYGVGDGSVAWGDYDNDGDLDLLVAGESGTFNRTKLYENKLINNPITGIDDDNFGINIYPNPVAQILNIECSTCYEYSISIVDMGGRVFLSKTLTGKNSLDIGHLKSGLYLLTIGFRNNFRKEKLLKIGN